MKMCSVTNFLSCRALPQAGDGENFTEGCNNSIIICYKCGGRNHWARDCNLGKQEDGTEVRCLDLQILMSGENSTVVTEPSSAIFLASTFQLSSATRVALRWLTLNAHMTVSKTEIVSVMFLHEGVRALVSVEG